MPNGPTAQKENKGISVAKREFERKESPESQKRAKSQKRKQEAEKEQSERNEIEKTLNRRSTWLVGRLVGCRLVLVVLIFWFAIC